MLEQKEGLLYTFETKSDKVRHFKGTAYMTTDFPLSVKQVLPLLEMLAPTGKHFEKIQQFFSVAIPDGMFPVKMGARQLALDSLRLATLHSHGVFGSISCRYPDRPDGIWHCDVRRGYDTRARRARGLVVRDTCRLQADSSLDLRGTPLPHDARNQATGTSTCSSVRERIINTRNGFVLGYLIICLRRR